MPKFNFEIPHQLSAADAKDRLERFIEGLEAKLGDSVKNLEQSWNGDTLSFGFRTFGINITGNLGVEEDRVTVEGDLPFSAMMFKGKIESEIRKQLERLLK